MKTYSLRKQLLGLIFIPVLIGAAIVGGVAMYFSYKEISEVYDAQLSHSAKVLLQLTSHELEEEDSYEIVLGAEHIDASHRYEKNITFRIWKGSHIVTQSDMASQFVNIAAPPGFSDQIVGGVPWRFFVFLDDRNDVTIEVAQRYEIREELILQILGSFFLPSLLFVPLIFIMIWLGTSRSLRPLLSVSKAVDKRDTHDLQPIEVERIPDEVLPLINALNGLLERLETGVKRERAFTDNAAHELRTPLAAMKTQTQVLLKKANSIPDCKDGLDNLHASIIRASHMIDQLLAFARMQSEDIEFSDLDFSALLSSVIRELTPLAVAKSQIIEADITEDIMLRGNEDALGIMVSNVIENAIKFTPEHGKITIALSKDGAFIVSDTGEGIPDSEKAAVLERFKRGKKVTENGSGLGLAMVDWCARKHSAVLTLGDNKPQGLLVTIKLKTQS